MPDPRLDDAGPWRMLPARLTFATGPYGQLAAEWGPGPELWAEVPGGQQGEQVLLIRDWPGVLFALRHRNLRRISPGHAMAGVTLQHRDGLLRRPDGWFREVINHLWTPDKVTKWQPVIARTAGRHAKTLAGAGQVDLVAGFCHPYVHDIIATLAGLGSASDEARMRGGGRLRELSDQTTGALLPSPTARGPAEKAWQELSDFLAPAVAAARAGRHESIMADTIQAWDAAGLTAEQAHHAAVCAYNGIPTTAPALARVLEQWLTRPGALQAVRDNGDMAAAVVREGIYQAAHFTFALPGILTTPIHRDGRVVAPMGCPVLPVVHAAHATRAREWTLAPGYSAGLAWGAGIHACLGRHLAPLILGEAVRALASLPRLELRDIPARWPAATMPSPRRIDVLA